MGGPPGGPGGEGPPGGGGGAPIENGEVNAQSAPQATLTPQQQAARRAFQNSPQLVAYRSFIGCAYVTIMTDVDAKAKGIQLENGRPGLLYVPGTGLVFIQERELPQGGGSLKAGASAPAASAVPSASAAPR